MTGSKRAEPVYQPQLEDLIPLSLAATLSGFSQGHVAHLIRTGELWGKKMGRNWVTTRQAVSDYLARDRRTGPKAKPAPPERP